MRLLVNTLLVGLDVHGVGGRGLWDSDFKGGECCESSNSCRRPGLFKKVLNFLHWQSVSSTSIDKESLSRNDCINITNK